MYEKAVAYILLNSRNEICMDDFDLRVIDIHIEFEVLGYIEMM